MLGCVERHLENMVGCADHHGLIQSIVQRCRKAFWYKSARRRYLRIHRQRCQEHAERYWNDALQEHVDLYDLQVNVLGEVSNAQRVCFQSTEYCFMTHHGIQDISVADLVTAPGSKALAMEI